MVNPYWDDYPMMVPTPKHSEDNRDPLEAIYWCAFTIGQKRKQNEQKNNLAVPPPAELRRAFEQGLIDGYQNKPTSRA